ncbi:class E sortase [Streptomyces sp. RFCAC02]|uniref:class E sortase n=1 Tax=Streptomyces sp. RFCAC02 TaxID=2499143 RepID=UPI00102129D6|nr:class E sortase [Streptomyces sp. RFCAC02]
MPSPTDPPEEPGAASGAGQSPPPEDTGPAGDPADGEPTAGHGPEPETDGAPGTEPDTDADDDADDETAVPAPAPVSAARRRAAAAVGVFGELLITGGVVLALFVVYSLWWTNVVANQEAKHDSDAVREHWAAGADDDGEDATVPPEYDPEDGIGFLHVPSMSDDDILVKEGIALDVLNGGVAGYYDEPVESAMPWDEEGNFALAAHRDGHGAKFHSIDHIEEGDPIVFETQNTWYIYRVFEILPETSKYDTGVIAPVPEGSGATEAGRYITLTTCTPVYTSRHRYIVWGELERTEPVDEARTPPAELREAD